jgi:Zn finger protein HypA/HybF involved in hydrogenase expression
MLKKSFLYMTRKELFQSYPNKKMIMMQNSKETKCLICGHEYKRRLKNFSPKCPVCNTIWERKYIEVI